MQSFIDASMISDLPCVMQGERGWGKLWYNRGCMIENINTLLKNLPNSPGIYRFFGEKEEVLYIGKAKNLKRRVSSYFQKIHKDIKTETLVPQIQRFEVTLTHSEKEAFLLEDQLIKTFQPRYNILLKDDKTYPFVTLSPGPFPRIAGIRSKTFKPGDVFGPYPSMFAVRNTIELLQKTFKLRTCEDAVFKNRTRPCLLYQIKRCTGPCVGLINQEDYAKDVESVRLFLRGKNQDILKHLTQEMDAAAERMEFETAARLRDQIKTLRELLEGQVVNTQVQSDIDVIAVSLDSGIYCIDLMEVRGGRILGNRVFYFDAQAWDTFETILQGFVEQYYFARGKMSFPDEIVVDHPIEMDEDLAGFFQAEFGRVPKINTNSRGVRQKWLGLALLNAKESLARHVLEEGRVQHRLAELQERLELTEPIKRIECFDISHTQGEETIGSCVVFDETGINKKQYRRFYITDIQKGDDYAAMRQVLMRRLKRLKEEGENYPDIMLIDGGKGQLKQAIEVMQELNIPLDPSQAGIQLVGVAKGVERKSGTEELWLPNRLSPIHLDPHDPAFHVIQQIRDEAHRFAITGHRKRRDVKRSSSLLEDIPGIGAKRRSAILKFFGGWQEVRNATYDELCKVPGVSPKLAQAICTYFKEVS